MRDRGSRGHGYWLGAPISVAQARGRMPIGQPKLQGGQSSG
jgi:hypothetical protein